MGEKPEVSSPASLVLGRKAKFNYDVSAQNKICLDISKYLPYTEKCMLRYNNQDASRIGNERNSAVAEHE